MIVIENVLDPYNDQNVSVKANVRKRPTFTIEPPTLDFGAFQTGSKWPGSTSFVLTNVSKHERAFLIEVHLSDAEAFAEISLACDDRDAGAALSKVQEEELEGLLQKLKIAQRKGKADKISKYESRLVELGVSAESTTDSDFDSAEDGPSAAGTPVIEAPALLQSAVSSISLALQPSMKTKIIVELLPRPGRAGPLYTTIKVNDRKNTDDTLGIIVTASLSSRKNSTASSLASSTPSSSSPSAAILPSSSSSSGPISS